MKLGVISDTHDRLTTFRRAMALFERLGVDAILHAGDFIAPFAAQLIAPAATRIPVHCVYGNNDGERDGLKATLPQVQDGPLHVELGGKRIVMAHFVDWLKPADVQHADIVISGHTHGVVQETRDGRLYLNPGECCGWVTERCTVALLEPQAMKAQIVDIHA